MAAEEAGVKASPTASPAPSTPKELSPQADLAKQTEAVKTELQESESAVRLSRWMMPGRTWWM